MLLVAPVIIEILYFVNLFGSFWTEIFSYLLLLVASICTFAAYYRTEFYLIDIVENSINEYKSYCTNLNEWLCKNWVSSSEEIDIVIARMKNYIGSNKESRAKYTERVFGLLKSLIIPVFLLVITNYLNNETNFIEALAHVIGIIVLIILLFLLFSTFWNIYNMFQVKKVVQMEKFVEDLQGVLDICINATFLGVEVSKQDEDENHAV